jgi:hypothetical protein
MIGMKIGLIAYMSPTLEVEIIGGYQIGVTQIADLD